MSKNEKVNFDETNEPGNESGVKLLEELGPNVARNINNLLKAQNISAKDLASKIHYSESAISKYRKGKAFPPLDFFYQLRNHYNISIDQFLFKQINYRDIHAKNTLSKLEQAEKEIYNKYCGTYLIYYFDTSNYKGRDDNSPADSLRYGILNISENGTDTDDLSYSCIAVFEIKNRKAATELKDKIDAMDSYFDIEEFVLNDEKLQNKIYYGKFELSAEQAFLTLTHERKDRALVILHRVNSNKPNYIGGIGTINSVSKGREPMPTAQYIIFSRYPLSLSAEEIHHLLRLGHPTYKANKDTKELISLFKKTYMTPEPDGEIHTDLEKELIIRVNMERYIKNSLKNNMFRCAKISNRDDADCYDLLKEVSIRNDRKTSASSES